ncbi:ORF965 [White spot syndrome virus]|uniref:ORF965 n=1 Tax=White spot syndrome virus TaxID=342409 RepID=A0A2D3I6F9_9VIRU|nr:ORF965 [White spot syndrome virus]
MNLKEVLRSLDTCATQLTENLAYMYPKVCLKSNLSAEWELQHTKIPWRGSRTRQTANCAKLSMMKAQWSTN